MRNRPIGIIVLAALIFITGLISLCGGLASIFSFGIKIIGSLFGISEAGGLLAGIYGISWALVTIFFGYSLWNLRPWARLGVLILQAVNLVYALVALFTPPGVPWLAAILAVVIIWYLSRPNVKAAFR